MDKRLGKASVIVAKNEVYGAYAVHYYLHMYCYGANIRSQTACTIFPVSEHNPLPASLDDL